MKMNLSAVDKQTPRGLIQGLLSTSSVSSSRSSRGQVLRTSSGIRTPAVRTEFLKPKRSSTKRKVEQDIAEVVTPSEDTTPRTLIGRVLNVQSTSEKVVRNKRRKTSSTALIAEPPPSSSTVTSAATEIKNILKTPSENSTPRTAIRSILQTAALETPAVHISPATSNQSSSLLSSNSNTTLPTIEEQDDETQAKSNELAEYNSDLTDTSNITEKVDTELNEDDETLLVLSSRSLDSNSIQESDHSNNESVNSVVHGASQITWSQSNETTVVTDGEDADTLQQTEIQSRNRTHWQNLVTPHITLRDHDVLPLSSDKNMNYSQQDVRSKKSVKQRPPGKRANKTKDAVIHEPHLPKTLVRSIFQHFSRAKVSRNAMQLVEQGSQLFFKQLASDLMAYCHHAGRSTIETADVELLIKRQGFITDKQNLSSLIEKYLPMEYRQEIIPTVQSGNSISLK